MSKPMVQYVVLHAYNPQNGLGGDGRVGGEHLAVTAELHAGRLHRDAGDPLCKPARKFYELWPFEGTPAALCKRCRAVAERLAAAGIAPSPDNPSIANSSEGDGVPHNSRSSRR